MNTLHSSAALVAGLATLTACSAPKPPPAPVPAVFVTVQLPTRGSVPDVLTVYGSAAPSLAGSVTLSVPQAGQVTRVTALPGMAVRAGQPLVGFATAPAALSSYTQAATALATAQRQRTTTAQLLGQQLATRDQLVQADKLVTDTGAALAALRRDDAGQATRTLTAPFSGSVTAVTVAPGDRTQPGAALVMLARTGSIVLTVGIDPLQRMRVKTGQIVHLEPLAGGGPRDGRILRVSNALNPRTRLVDVDIGLAPGTMLQGEAMSVGIVVGSIGGWLVPHRAVIAANGVAQLFQVASGKASVVKVVVRSTDATTDVVEGPVDTHRPVIVDGAYQVAAGDVVRIGPR